jgi:Tfp pilus assembly protein PilF
MSLTKHGALAGTIACLACCACTHTVESAYKSQRRNAVSTVMSRQIEGAVDAGSGDPEMHTLRQRLAADAHDMNARITLARLYAKRGYPDLALEHYRMAMLQDPDSLVAVLELAKALRQMDQKETALEACQFYSLRHPWDAEKGTEKKGQLPPSWEIASLEGVLQDELGRLEPAEQAHRAALKLDPSRSSLHNNLGYNLLLQNKPKEAATEFQAALKLDPRSEIAHNNLGAALALLAPPGEPAKPPKKGKPDPQKALSDWERSQDPAVAHNNLAVGLIEQGRWPEARQELQAALDANPGFGPALANLQLVSASDGNPASVSLAARPKHVNFWKRAASTILGGDAPAAKPVVSPPAPAPVAAIGAGDGVQ